MGDDPQAGSIWSIWHDPTAYDHMQVGPPYLPDTKRAKIGAASDTTLAAQFGTLDLLGPQRDQMIALMVDAYEAPMAELAALLACLRAAAQLHQTNHWRIKGAAFYADHQLFDRLYKDSLPMIDQVAERAVGQGSQRLVNPTIQAGQVFSLVTFFSGGLDTAEPGPQECVGMSLDAEKATIQFIDTVYKRLQSKGQLSSGTDNLLQGVADKHEEFVYLLQQRNSIKLGSYDRGPRDWSAD